MRVPFLLLLVLVGTAAGAQWLQGTIAAPGAFGSTIRLLGTRGTEHPVLDSTVIGPEGGFAFDRPLGMPGFGQLALNDTDRVDLILSPAEPAVLLSFPDLPLQEHIRILASEENRRLWEHKLMSRRSQALQLEVQADRATTHPDSLGQLALLDSLEERAIALREAHLMRMIDEDPESYFAHVVRSTRAMEAAVRQGPDAVARAFDFGDPSLLRSASYAKAIVGYLQSLRAVSEDQFVSASDTLLALAAADTACHRYMLESLIEIYAQYGPDRALQHVVDRYASVPDVHLAPRIRDLVSAQLSVAVGRTGPDLVLPVPGGDTLVLSEVAARNRYTLLFYYSSTCDHCHAQMPGIAWSWRDHHAAGFEVVGIALDSDTAEFFTTIRERALPWSSTSELMGWGSPAAKAYAVRATPSFVLLDSRLRIVSKPMDAVDLEGQLRELLP